MFAFTMGVFIYCVLNVSSNAMLLNYLTKFFDKSNLFSM